MPIQKISVLGAGQMGAGIAQVCAVAGFEVVMRDVEDRFLVKGLAAIDAGLARAAEKGKVSEDARASARARIRPTTRLDDAGRGPDPCPGDRKSTRLNSSHSLTTRMPSSA